MDNEPEQTKEQRQEEIEKEISDLKSKMGLGDNVVNPNDLSQDVDTSSLDEDSSLILGKFKSMEELEKAYVNLEKKIGTPAEAEVDEAVSEKVEEEIGKKPEEKAKGPIPGISMEELNQLSSSYAANENKLSEADYELLANKGYPQDMVDAYIRGIQARQTSFLEYAGGQESFNTMSSWARANLSQSEISSLNAHLASTNDADVYMAIDSLTKKYEAKHGAKPKLLKGKTPAGGSQSGYRSTAEVIKDMKDPRYKPGTKQYDPAFVQRVRTKLKHSGNI